MAAVPAGPCPCRLSPQLTPCLPGTPSHGELCPEVSGLCSLHVGAWVCGGWAWACPGPRRPCHSRVPNPSLHVLRSVAMRTEGPSLLVAASQWTFRRREGCHGTGCGRCDRKPPQNSDPIEMGANVSSGRGQQVPGLAALLFPVRKPPCRSRGPARVLGLEAVVVVVVACSCGVQE